MSAVHTSQAIPGTAFASDTEDRPSDFDSEGGAHVYIADAISTWNDEPFIETGFGSGGAPSVSTGLDLVDAVDVSRGSESRVEAAGQGGTEDGCSMMVATWLLATQTGLEDAMMAHRDGAALSDGGSGRWSHGRGAQSSDITPPIPFTAVRPSVYL